MSKETIQFFKKMSLFEVHKAYLKDYFRLFLKWGNPCNGGVAEIHCIDIHTNGLSLISFVVRKCIPKEVCSTLVIKIFITVMLLRLGIHFILLG